MLSYLRYIEMAALLAVLVVLARRSLISHYPAFTMFLAGKGACALCLLPLDPNDLLYGKSWAFSTPFLMVLQLLVLLELMGKVVEHYPRIEKKGARLIISSCFGIGAIIGAVSYVFEFRHHRYPWYVPAVIGADKAFAWVTLGSLIFLSVWFKMFPEPMRKNVQWHRWLLATYLGLAPGVTLIFATMESQNGRIRYDVNCCQEVVEIACFILWMAVMRPAGEAFPYVQKRLSEEDLKRLDADYKEVFSTLRQEYPLPEIVSED